MAKLRVTFACYPYDRMQALQNGSVVPEGVDLNFVPLEVEEIFWRQLKHYEFDVSELGFSNYIIPLSRGEDRFVAIPVFPSRFFRHSCVYVNVNKGIKAPGDLLGKTVGVPEYEITAVVWLRGIFQEEYGVHPRDVHWRGGGIEVPGRPEKLKLNLPPDIDYKPIPADKTLSRMLDEGEIDALFTARAPSAFTSGSPNVARLFESYWEVEEDYFRRTGIFPIMHTVVIKRKIYEENPWLAMSLYKAFAASKNMTLKALQNTASLHSSLPWLVRSVEHAKKLMGDDWWTYGIEKNRHALDTLCRYHFEQGLAARRVAVEELFAPETFDEFKI